MENEQANQGIKEIKLLTVGLTGEYELLTWVEKNHRAQGHQDLRPSELGRDGTGNGYIRITTR